MATIKYLADINLDKNSLNNAVIQNLSTAPSSPADGQIYYDTDTNDLNIYNGSGWVQLGATGAGDIESVVAGDGLTGGATSGAATLNVVGGTGITANANDIAIDATVATLSGSQTLTNKTIAASQVTEISNLTAGEGAQLENIGSTTISAAQWGYLGAATGAITNSDTVDMGDGFVLEDADGTEVTITENKEVKFTGTGGLTINWTDVSTGSDADPYDLQFAIGTLNQDTSGKAASADTLEDARTIGGVSFDGSANIDLPGVNSAGNQATSGNAATATKISSITNSNIVQLTASQTLTNKTIAASQVTEISNITAAEGAQLENIGSTTISATQWGYLGAASGAITNTDTNDDVSNANLLTKLAALESAGGAANQDIVIGTDSGDTIVITGNLQVDGTTTTVNSETLSTQDNNIVLASGNSTGAVLDGTGLTFEGGTGDDVSLQWLASATSLELKKGSSYAPMKVSTLTAASIVGELTGNASTATTLATARTIGGVSFNGSANINLPGVNSAGNQNTSGSAATLTTARTIGGVSFNGSANINLPGVNSAGNQNTSGSAATLTTARAINGVDFDGSAAITVTAAAGTLSGDTLKSSVTASSLTSVGTLASGNATAIVTAASVSAAGKVELATTAEALAGSDSARAVTPAGLAARSYRAAIGDGSATAIAVTHSLGTRDVNVQMYDASSYETVMAQVVRTDANNVTVTFNTAPTSGDVIILISKVD